MVFVYCVFCNSVSNVRSSQLPYSRPTIRDHYRTTESSVFERYRYPTSSEDICSCGTEYSATKYSTWDESLHGWTNPVNGWHRTKQQHDVWLPVADVVDDCHHSYKMHNCINVYSCDYPSVKRRAQLFEELSSSHRCQFCNVIQG